MKGTPVFAIAAVALGGSQAAVPVEKEPHHRLVFENAYVKVLDVLFPPGVVSLFHRHSMDNVAVRITGGRLRSDLPDAEGPPRDVSTGSVAFNDGRQPYVHRVSNIGTTEVRIIDVELVNGRPASVAVADAAPGHTLVFENERVRVRRIGVEPGQSLAPHAHPNGWLDVNIVGGTPGQFSWRDGGAVVPEIAAVSAPVEIVEVEPR